MKWTELVKRSSGFSFFIILWVASFATATSQRWQDTLNKMAAFDRWSVCCCGCQAPWISAFQLFLSIFWPFKSRVNWLRRSNWCWAEARHLFSLESFKLKTPTSTSTLASAICLKLWKEWTWVLMAVVMVVVVVLFFFLFPSLPYPLQEFYCYFMNTPKTWTKLNRAELKTLTSSRNESITHKHKIFSIVSPAHF